MLRTRLKVIVGFLLACVAVHAPGESWAQTTINLSGSANNMCLASQNGLNVICSTGGSPTVISAGWPITINGNGGDDIIRVRGEVDAMHRPDYGDCTCTCSGAGIGDFIYAGSLIINGGADHDSLYAADGGDETTALFGGDGIDYLRGGSGNGDILHGGAAVDVIYDPGGEDEAFFGGAGYDDMRDRTCDYDEVFCDCDVDDGEFWGCVGHDCDNCDQTTSTFYLACP